MHLLYCLGKNKLLTFLLLQPTFDLCYFPILHHFILICCKFGKFLFNLSTSSSLILFCQSFSFLTLSSQLPCHYLINSETIGSRSIWEVTNFHSFLTSYVSGQVQVKVKHLKKLYLEAWNTFQEIQLSWWQMFLVFTGPFFKCPHYLNPVSWGSAQQRIGRCIAKMRKTWEERDIKRIGYQQINYHSFENACIL